MGNFDLIDDSEIKDAYEYYANRIEPHKIEKVREIYNELVNSIYLVQIECGSEVSAFRLFESLNDKGLDLSAVDLVKNRVFMEANQNDSIDEERVKALWEDIMTIIRPEINQMYRFFTHYYMSIPSPEIKDNVSKNKLYDYVDELLSGELANNGISLEEMLEDMRTKAEVYVDIKNCEVSENFQKSRIQELNSKLRSTQIKNDRIRTLLLKIVIEYESADEVLEALNILEILNTRDKIAGRDSNTSRDRFWSKICSKMNQHDNPNMYLRRIAEQRSPNNTIMKERIINRDFKNNDFTKYILDRIEEEHYMRSSGNEKSVANRDTVDIEHIAPQRIGADKYDEWEKYLNCTKEEFQEYKKRIGNLTLLNDSLNQTASDNPFEQKRQIYKHKTDFLMTQAVAEEYDEWRIEQIKHRSEKMADIICEVWNMDNV